MMSQESFVCIVADPPWQYDELKTGGSMRSGVSQHYPTISVNDICMLSSTARYQRSASRYRRLSDMPPPPPLSIAEYQIADTAILWLWITNSFLLDGSGVRVCRAWGFEPKQIVTWIKGRVDQSLIESKSGGMHYYSKLILNMGMGHYTRGCTEHIIVGVRGTATKLIDDKGVSNVIVTPRLRHSQKPKEAYELIERVQHRGPRLELFARQYRIGWTVHGDEIVPIKRKRKIRRDTTK